MTPSPLSKSQAAEKILLEHGLGWLIQKLGLHNGHLPDGTTAKFRVVQFIIELPQVRRELCWIRTYSEFQARVEHFRRTIRVVTSVLEQSKAVIMANRKAQRHVPVWPDELEWDY
ncbi:hypothetical protein L5515_018604 [Caenorhabditis briggsae]|uniref:Uncharacterized protein n=1 Tax=Caenorhabditis briggsae TaxID=6238 RepID=A0AAE9JUH4_CAEBR|nr:hypothetical protein L5515_018604 [Caenorhabditis briggsae]